LAASAVLRHTRSRQATASPAAPCICRPNQPVKYPGIMAIELVSPNGTQHIENRHINGNLSAIGIVCQDVVMPGERADQDKNGARLLYEEALAYIDRWNASESRLAALLQLQLVRPVPTVVNLGGVLDVTWLMDMPHEVEWQGLYMDADLRATEAVRCHEIPDLASDPVALFTQLSGLQGSVLENRLFEDDFGVGSISTAKLLGHAAQAGIPILTIDRASIGTLLPALPFADNIKADITNAVSQGLVVRIPGSEISYEDWAGIGYIKQDPATFEAGYMLSGGIAGGMTAWYIWRWDDTPLHVTSSYNDNPAAACYIQRISGTDLQEGLVNTTLDKKLQVRVTDSLRKPVSGAPVTFILTAGGGALKAGTEQGTVVHAVTNHLGIAGVSLTLGEKTSNNPVFRKRPEEKPYAQQVSCHIVDAALDNGTRLLKPFSAYAFPGEPVQFLSPRGNNKTGDILSYAGTIALTVADEFGNPVSNVDLVFDAQTPAPDTDPLHRGAMLLAVTDPCISVEEGRIPAYGDCGADKQTVATSHKGAGVGVILGGTAGANYSVTVTSDKVTGSAAFNLYTFSMDQNREYVHLSAIYLSDGAGHNLNACKVGEGATFPVYAKCYRLVVDDDGTPDDETDDFWTIRTFDGKVTMDGYDGDLQADYLYTYKKSVPINTAGYHEIPILAVKNGDTLNAISYHVYGVEFVLVDAANEPVGDDKHLYLPVDENGIVREDYLIRYRINPSGYTPGLSYVLINKGDTLIHYMVPERDGTQTPYVIWQATLSRGTMFDTEAAHTVEAILNYGADPPVRMTATAPLEIVRADIDADLYNTGQANEDDPDETLTGLFVQVNNDDDNATGQEDFKDGTSGTEENDLVGAKLFGRIGLGTMTLTASTTGPGRVKIWGNPDKTGLLIDMTSGLNSTSWDVTTTLEKEVWIEGITTSGAHADIDLTLTTQTDDGQIVADDRLTVTVCDISILTDFNRDRKIDDIDKQAGANGDTFYFWLNDDNDNGKEVATDSSQDVPGASGWLSLEDGTDGEINGTRDLIDFFPIQVTVIPKGILDVSGIEATLMMEQGVLKMAGMDITDGNLAGSYLTNVTIAKNLEKADTYKFKPQEARDLPDAVFKDKLDATGQVFLLAEGVEPIISGTTAETKKALVLRLARGSNILLTSRLNLSIDGVEKMFRHKNLRRIFDESIKESMQGPDDRDTAPNFPDDPNCDKDFVFIHGYNVSGEAARGWHCEVFKRLFWGGLKARFHGVSWLGNQGQVENIPVFGDKTINYYTNGMNAFITAPHLRDFINNELGESVTLAAHSLGNMVSAEAIAHHAADVERFFMLNAAVAMESLDGTVKAVGADGSPGDMDHPEWDGYDERLFCSEWYTLFAPNDKRSDLTWRDYFGSVLEVVYNFYSPGEEVLAAHPHHLVPSFTEVGFISGEYSWAMQEKLKGRNQLGGSILGGWGFNDDPPDGWYKPTGDVLPGGQPAAFRRYTPAETEAEILMDTSVLKTKPFFKTGGPAIADLYTDTGGSQFAEENFTTLMVAFASARSFALGANELPVLVLGKNINMEALRGTGFEWPEERLEEWGTRWLHSDLKNVAYIYTHKLFDELVYRGGR